MPFAQGVPGRHVAIVLLRESAFAQIAKYLETSGSRMRRWVRIQEIGGGDRVRPPSREAVEDRELCMGVKLLGREVQVLRRVAAYLSHANLPGPKGSTRS